MKQSLELVKQSLKMNDELTNTMNEIIVNVQQKINTPPPLPEEGIEGVVIHVDEYNIDYEQINPFKQKFVMYQGARLGNFEENNIIGCILLKLDNNGFVIDVDIPNGLSDKQPLIVNTIRTHPPKFPILNKYLSLLLQNITWQETMQLTDLQKTNLEQPIQSGSILQVDNFNTQFNNYRSSQTCVSEPNLGEFITIENVVQY